MMLRPLRVSALGIGVGSAARYDGWRNGALLADQWISGAIAARLPRQCSPS